MKIHVVSAALLLVMSGAAHAVNVYQGDTSDLSIFGRLEGGFYNKYANQTRENHVRNKAGINGEARLGVKATSEIVTNIKGVAFGAIISIVGCFKGLNAKQGAEGVGLATTASVVLSIILIFISDYFLTVLLYVDK